MLYSTVNLETMIAGNNHRIVQAKISAASGLNHFIALHYTYDALRERAGELQSLQIIPETQLGDRTSYDVKVHFSPRLSERQYVVESTGYYKKGRRVIAVHPTKALFQGEQ
jgi:hypothetical protein